MATSVSPRVLDWLRAVLSKDFHSANRTFDDVVHCLASHPTLSVRTNVYTFDNGASALLLNLTGPLSILHAGQYHQCPISLWITHQYPQTAPIIFVVPTSDRVIHPNHYVGAEGRVYHPYLAEWRDQPSNLLQLLAILKDVFSYELPLTQRTTATEDAALGSSSRVEDRSSFASHGNDQGLTFKDPRFRHSSEHERPPILPPKPFQPTQRSSFKYDRPPPLPADPIMSGMPSTDSTRSDPMTERVSVSHAPRYEPQTRGIGSGYDVHQNYHGNRPANLLHKPYDMSHHAAYTTINNGIGHGLAHPTHAYPNENRQAAHAVHTRGTRPIPAHSASVPHPIDDLLTSPLENILPAQNNHVPGPPLPPNPHKDAILLTLSQTLTQRVQATYAQNMAAMAPLRAQQNALTSTMNGINKEITQLEELAATLTINEDILRKAMTDADMTLEVARNRNTPHADDVLVPPSVVAGQLYQAVTDKNAIEDCRNVLGKALDRGRIESSVWAKQVRSLAREEFLKKALINKISHGMGLDDGE